jgi:hypothetical protein
MILGVPGQHRVLENIAQRSRHAGCVLGFERFGPRVLGEAVHQLKFLLILGFGSFINKIVGRALA